MFCHPAMFPMVCVPVRMALALGVSRISSTHGLRIWAIAGAIIALGFTTLSLGIVRRDASCGSPIWWKEMRPIHALLYAASATLAWYGHAKLAGVCLLMDVIVGIACKAFFKND
jgi:hypothetical protein